MAETLIPKPDEAQLPLASATEKDILLALYAAACDQNKLYAGFRWKVLSFMSTLEGALLYATVQSSNNLHKLLYSTAGIAATIFLLALEERHKTIFYQARTVARDLETKLGVSQYGVFNVEMRKRGKHNLIVRFWCFALIVAWVLSFVVFLVRSSR